MDSEEHTRKRCLSLDNRTTNRQGNLWSLPKWNLDLTSFSLKYSSKCALKSPKRRGLARLASARRPNSNRQAIFFFADLPLEQRFITTSQGVINLSQIFSLNSVIPSFRNRIYSVDKVIPEIRHIYSWNSVIPPFRNRPCSWLKYLTVCFICQKYSQIQREIYGQTEFLEVQS